MKVDLTHFPSQIHRPNLISIYLLTHLVNSQIILLQIGLLETRNSGFGKAGFTLYIKYGKKYVKLANHGTLYLSVMNLLRYRVIYTNTTQSFITLLLTAALRTTDLKLSFFRHFLIDFFFFFGF